MRYKTQSPAYVHKSQTALFLILEAVPPQPTPWLSTEEQYGDGVPLLCPDRWHKPLSFHFCWRGTQPDILCNTHGARHVRGQGGAGRRKPCGQSGWRCGRARKTAKEKGRKTISSPALQQLPISFLPQVLARPLVTTEVLSLTTVSFPFFVLS